MSQQHVLNTTAQGGSQGLPRDPRGPWAWGAPGEFLVRKVLVAQFNPCGTMGAQWHHGAIFIAEPWYCSIEVRPNFGDFVCTLIFDEVECA